MQDIRTILSEHAEGISDEAKAEIEKAVKANYKTVAEWEKKTTRIATLEEQVNELSAKVAETGDAEKKIQEMQTALNGYKAADEQRKAEEEKAAKRNEFSAKFNEAVEGREFANEIVRQSVFDQAFTRCEQESGLGAKDAIEAIIAEQQGIWANPQTDPRKMPSKDQLTASRDNEQEKRNFASLLFGKPN